MPTKTKDQSDYISALNMNGLEGRVLRLPAPKGKTKEILFIYGQHSSLERWWGLAQEFNRYGAITMPDLPGFGGMDSLYKIGEQATIDNLADYLAAYIKLKYRQRKVTIVAMSLGFVVVTRMLQRCPELTNHVESLISIVGFAHKDDFSFSRKRMLFYKLVSRLFSRRLPAAIFKATALRPFVLKKLYHRTHNAREKFKYAKDDDSFRATMNMEVQLWTLNDIRTQFKTYTEMFALDNCQKRISLPVYHVAVGTDRYFDNTKVEQHFRQIFSDVEMFESQAPNHAPTIIADPAEAAAFMPIGLKRKVLYKRKSKN